MFYAAIAYWVECRGTDRPDDWNHWNKIIVPWLIELQNPDGSWTSSSSIDVSTAMILCALMVSNERTPFFMR